MSNPLQEKFLLYRVRVRKDPEAFGKIYDLYARRIYRFVFFKVSSEEEAQDLTADVFLKAWQYVIDEKGRDVKHLGALLYSIARNRVIDYYRMRATRDTVLLLDGAEEVLPDERMAPGDAERKIDADLLLAHVRALKDEYREVLVLRYLDELEHDEIADILGKQKGNVRVLLHRATNALRELAEKSATPEPSHETTGPDGTTAGSQERARGRNA